MGNDTTAMLPCPFCGGEAKAWDRNPAIVGCVTPGCSIVTRDPGYNLPDKTAAQISAERWNRRAALAGQADAVATVAGLNSRGEMIVRTLRATPIGAKLYTTPPAAIPVDALRALIADWRSHDHRMLDRAADELAELIAGATP